MKQLIKKTIALIFTVLLCALPTVQAKEIDDFCLKQILVSEETIQQNDLYITVSVFEDENIANTITHIHLHLKNQAQKLIQLKTPTRKLCLHLLYTVLFLSIQVFPQLAQNHLIHIQ